ncbi:MAG: DUF2848 family protein [Chloroflexi bacterium]|nr:DUF2848 family protein [Chloroflexota bacterium]
MLTFQIQGSEQTISLQPRRLVIAGYTGRDQASVQLHVEELRAHGVPAPLRVPALFACTADRLTTSDEVEVLGSQTSGEAEFVLIHHHGRVYVAAGSDHTDRELERTSVTMAKQVCPKLVSGEVWPLEEVSERWDTITLRGAARGRPAYQVGRLGELLPPAHLQALIQERLGDDVEDLVVFGGTLPIHDGGGFAFGAPFTATLEDSASGCVLRCAYVVRETALTGDG